MRIMRRILASAAVAAIAAGGIVAVTEAPAVAATHYCTYKAVTNSSNYVRAENYGYGGSGPCSRVRARAQDDTGGALYFRYGCVCSPVSKIEEIGYPLVFRQTRAAPIYLVWAGWIGTHGTLTRSVTT